MNDTEDFLGPMPHRAIGSPCPDPASAVVSVRRVENGWMVQVHNPVHYRDPNEKFMMAMANILPSLNAMAGAGAVRGVDEELDPHKKNDAERDEDAAEQLKKMQKVIKDAMADPPQIRKEYENYVFLTHDKLMAFLSEQTSGALKS